MEGIVITILLAALSIPVLLIVLAVAFFRLKNRVDELQAKVDRLNMAPQPAPALGSDIPKTEPDSSGFAETPEPEAATEDVDREAIAAVGPWDKVAQGSSEPLAAEIEGPPKAVVLRRERLVRLGVWLRENWFYAVSALSLALAGVFLVQYGMEAGLLPPGARVTAALAFGLALVGGGEFIRRRYGDEEGNATAYLPSTFSGAGIVTLFAAILSARLLYDLIGPEIAMIGLISVAALSLILGWFHGPLLAAVGVIGAIGAPFAVGGSSDDVSWLYGYFALIVFVGLAIDAVRRWAWITVITLVLGYGAGWLLVAANGSTAWIFGLYVTLLALLSIAIPVLSLTPRHAGTMIAEVGLRRLALPWPEFPTRIAFGAMVASSGALVLVSLSGQAEFWLAIACLTLVVIALIVWCADARALQDQTIIPAAGLFAAVALQAIDRQAVYTTFIAERMPESSMPLQASYLVAIGIVLSVLCAWRSNGRTEYGVIWAAGAALIAPAMAIILDVYWRPIDVIGAYPWALHAAAISALMVVMAERFARADGDDRLRTSLAVLSALAAIAFGCVILLSSAALTVAFAVTVVAAAALDRRFNLPVMTVYICVGVVTLGYRLLADPGLGWAERAPLVELLVANGGTLIALIAALSLVSERGRRTATVFLESAAWATAAMLTSLLLNRGIETLAGFRDTDSHWALSLHGMIWIVAALAQMYRTVLGGRLRYVRLILATVFGTVGGAAIFASVTIANPLQSYGETVLGWPVINTLIVAYLLPALLLAAAALRMPNLVPMLRKGMAVVAAGLAALWLALTIRHVWQGSGGMRLGGVSQPELYSYTVALLVIGAGLFYQSLARHSARLRLAGLIVIGLAVAKVFVVDISGLGGLTRVFSLLALGLSLAGLAWLNRWAQTNAPPEAKDTGQEDQGDA